MDAVEMIPITLISGYSLYSLSIEVCPRTMSGCISKLVSDVDNLANSFKHLDLFAEGRRYHQHDKDTSRSSKRIRTRVDSFSAQSIVQAVVTDGESRLRTFLQRFSDGFRFQNEPLRLEKFQIKFVDMVVPVLAPNIVGPQWTAIGPRLSREFGWELKRMPKMLLGQAPRRFGKTISLGAIMLNYSLSVSGCIQSAFSTSKRASQKLKAKVLQICVESGYEDWIWRSGEEQLYLRDPDNEHDTTRQMNFYPSNKVIDPCCARAYSCVVPSSLLRASQSHTAPSLKIPNSLPQIPKNRYAVGMYSQCVYCMR